MISKSKLKQKGVNSHLINCYIAVSNTIKVTKSIEDLVVLKNKQQKIENVLRKQYGILSSYCNY